jgi:hypothetical protein
MQCGSQGTFDPYDNAHTTVVSHVHPLLQCGTQCETTAGMPASEFENSSCQPTVEYLYEMEDRMICFTYGEGVQ